VKEIIPGNSVVLGILGRPKETEEPLRMLDYCRTLVVEDGVLLHNVLTRELLLLTREEHADALANPYLREHWFTVPAGTVEGELLELVRWVRTAQEPSKKFLSGFTIFPTTACNARCFYCFEAGCKKTVMTEETAHRAAKYIAENRGEHEVTLGWFGGEPLMNVPAIDLICRDLKGAGVPFHSKMISNGYLFTDELAARAADLWKMRQVQITLDGTEEVYNRTKAYVGVEGSPYRRVLDNIDRLLNVRIPVVVRMNLDLHNTGELLALARELVERFEGKKGLRAYVSPIFDEHTPWNERHTPEEWEQIFAVRRELEEFFLAHGLGVSGTRRLKRDLPMHYCMADSGSAAVILPEGHLGLCEHFADSEIYGHIDRPERDEKMIASWKERFEPIPECERCANRPECMELKKCTGYLGCFEQSRKWKEYTALQSMAEEYRLWREGKAGTGEQSASEEEANC